MKKTSAFGKPKPLPGQAGYGAKVSTKLEDETVQMENKLRVLRDQMAQEQLRRDSSSKVGGSRWRSARADRGTVRNYAKDVKDGKVKVPKKKKQPQTAPPKQIPKPVSELTFKDKTVNAWEVIDAIAWLETLNLGRYGPAFQTNEISGPILLEVGLEDLDYMEIKMPAHRKLMLKAIESLKKHGRYVPLKQTQSPRIQQAESSSNAVGGEARSAKLDTEAKRVHWSEAKPLSENEIKGDGTVPVNLADGVYDERAAHESFLAAVNEWRSGGGGGKIKVVNEADIFGKGVGETQTEGKGLFSSFGAGSEDTGMWNNPFAEEAKDESKDDLPPVDPNGGKLLQGTLDEETEHKAFASAVENWRKGKSGGESLAEELALKMDEEHDKQVADLAIKKDTLKRQQSNIEQKKNIEHKLSLDGINAGRVEEPITPTKQNPPIYENDVEFVDPSTLLATASPPLSEASSNMSSPRNGDVGVSISLVESTMGFDPKFGEAEEKHEYTVVEEEDDDDA
mmetsp:Transcript_28563/g.37396  ORF Transcript_28563/g.37396 Transcript_28563/m.37396 type:complete len:509 (-) Transcript_28563:116-1642(-)